MTTITTKTIQLPFTRLLIPDEGYRVSRLQQHPGRDGVAFNATIRRHGKIVGSLINDGFGGSTDFRPERFDKDVPGDYQARIKAWEAFAAAVGPLNPPMPPMWDGDDSQMLWDGGEVLMTEFDETKRLNRAKTTAFTVADPGDGLPIDTFNIGAWKFSGKGAALPNDPVVRKSVGDGKFLIWRHATSTWAPLP